MDEHMAAVRDTLQRVLGRPWLHRLLVAMVGLTFIVSALAKSVTIDGTAGERTVQLSPLSFELTILKQKVVSSRSAAGVLARLVIGIELLLGLLCFQPAHIRTVVLPFAAVLLIGFTLYLMTTLGRVEDCGCFGDLVAFSPPSAIAKNIVLLGIVAAAFVGAARERKRYLGAVIATVVTVLFVIIALPFRDRSPDVSQSESTTTSNPFSVLGPVPRADGETDILTGIRLVAFLSLECDHCREVARMLGDIGMQFPADTMTAVFLGVEEQVPDFVADTDTAFPYVIVSPTVFFDFIGDAPPRVYILDNGTSVGFWDEKTFDLDEIEATLIRLMSPVAD